MWRHFTLCIGYHACYVTLRSCISGGGGNDGIQWRGTAVSYHVDNDKEVGLHSYNVPRLVNITANGHANEL